jgi:hypothetical protein
MPPDAAGRTAPDVADRTGLNRLFRWILHGTTRAQRASDLSRSLRFKRGMHRIGLALATLLGGSAMVVGLLNLQHDVEFQKKRLMALRCVDAKSHRWRVVSAGAFDPDKFLEEAEIKANPLKKRAVPSRTFQVTSHGETYEVIGPQGATKEQAIAKTEELIAQGRYSERPRLAELLGCNYARGIALEEFNMWQSATTDEIAASRTKQFSYFRAAVDSLASTAYLTSMTALISYFSIAAFAWVVRGFMRD